MCACTVYHCIYVATCSFQIDPAISQTPPLTLIAHEGDRIYLPCFNRPEEIQAWSFLGSLYPAHELPSWVEETPNGLIIDQAVQSLSGTYTCFTYNQQSFTLQELSTVYFTVDTLPRSERPQVQGKAAGKLTLVVFISIIILHFHV